MHMVLEDMIALCRQAQQTRAECEQARAALQATRAETRALLAQIREVRPAAVWEQVQVLSPPLRDPLGIGIEPLDREKHALHMIRAILNDFPLEMQATLVKALTMRTMVLLHDELRRPMPFSA